MASGIINMTSNYSDYEGRIIWSSVLDEANGVSTLKFTYQVRRVGYEATIGGNSSSYTVNSNMFTVEAAALTPGWFEGSTSGNVLVDNDASWTTLCIDNSQKVYHSQFSGRGIIKLNGGISGVGNGARFSVSSAEIKLDRIFEKARLTSAPNFNDEDNPTIKYSHGYVDVLQAAITTDANNYTELVPFRDVGIYSTSYTFELTTAERNALINAVKGKTSMLVRFYLRMTIDGTPYQSYLIKTLTINGDAPKITASIEDVQTLTKNLTGGGLKFIRGNNSMKFSMTAAGQKGATISKYSVVCGSRTINSSSGTFTNIENDVVIFSATDSRGQTSTKTIELEPIDYIKLTCNQEVKMILESDDSAQMALKIEGNYFNGSFGAKNNTLSVYTRHKRNNESYGEWADITPLLASNTGGRYYLTADMSGFDPSGTYTFQCKAVDALGEVVTGEYAVQFVPVFDWSKDDFNFNVPVNMNGQTVLRHNATANNIVLSASGGFIYFRQGGTNDTSTEVKITPQGNIELTGDILINGQSLKSLLGIN